MKFLFFLIDQLQQHNSVTNKFLNAYASAKKDREIKYVHR